MPPNVSHGSFPVAGTIGDRFPKNQVHGDGSVTEKHGEEAGSTVEDSRTPEQRWVCAASEKSIRTVNPIRAIVDPIVASSVKCGKERGDGKDQISLALGDPTAFGNFKPCPAIVDAITSALHSPSFAAGYVNACGTDEARSAIAAHHSDPECGAVASPGDVIVASGCSGALELALTALLDEGSVLLAPRPGFPLYQVIAESHGATVAQYDLLPDRGWECDLVHMEELILEAERTSGKAKGERTEKRAVRGIVINNPSNPTGSVYSERHLREVIDLALKHRLPIVADEVYGDLTYGDSKFLPLARVAARYGRAAPIITASGLGKQFLVPGWRVGWIVFHDGRSNALQDVKAGAKRLAQVVLGASHLAQRAVPAVLAPPTDAERQSVEAWREDLKSALERQAALTYERLCSCCGLEPVIAPQGAMYLCVRIRTEEFDDVIVDDVAFTKLLLEEENVFALPGRAFGVSGGNCHVFRVVFCAPVDTLEEAFCRMEQFCLRHTLL